MPTNHRDLDSIFNSALGIASIEQRRQFLDEACAGNPEARGEIDLLLQAHDRAGRFLENSPAHENLPKHLQKLRQENSQIDQPSLLRVFSEQLAEVPRVILKDAEPASDPIIHPTTAEVVKVADHARYEVHGEIARGGMGAILKARDCDLGRELAIKVLLDEHKDKPDVVGRFIEEAQIGGQLQHPGIAPIYDWGKLPDQRPYFMMKLIKGRTLSALLTERVERSDDRTKYLTIFEQVCQAIAYSHSRGVIHRDLKPANIMVGAFGEVQVMDWGLAKVLTEGGVADERREQQYDREKSSINTVRSGSDTNRALGSHTQIGSAMGTPAFMPPEQALGDIDEMDQRADVFGLGAILCVILTGDPPYVADSGSQVLRLASRGRLDDCHRRLDTCGADVELIELAKECLQPEASHRPRDAGVLRDRIQTYLVSVETRLHEAEIKRASNDAKTVEERKRRRVMIALAASLVLLLGFGAWTSHESSLRKLSAESKIDNALYQARLHQSKATNNVLSVQVAELEKAVDSAELANELAEARQIDAQLRQNCGELLTELRVELNASGMEFARRNSDREFVAKLEFIRATKVDQKSTPYQTAEIDNKVKGRLARGKHDVRVVSRAYEDAFRTANLDVRDLSIDQICDRIQNSSVRNKLLFLLDDWAQMIQPLWGDTVHIEDAGDFKAALAVRRRKLRAVPDSSVVWTALAPLILVFEGKEQYRTHCQQMLEQFSSVEVEAIVGHLCLSVYLAGPSQVPGKTPNIAILDIPVDEALLRRDLFVNLADALVSFRNGRLKRAEKLSRGLRTRRKPLRDLENDSADNLLCMSVDALVHSKTKPVDAKRIVEEFRSHLANGLRRTGKLPGKVKGRHWFYIALVLAAEAEANLSDDPVPDLDLAVRNQLTGFADQTENQSESLRHSQLHSRLIEVLDRVGDSSIRSLRLARRERDIRQLKEVASSENVQQMKPDTLAWLAFALRDLGEAATAAQALETVQHLYPDHFQLNYELAQCLIEAGKTTQGIGLLRAALATQPNSVGAHWTLAKAYRLAKKRGSSLNILRRLEKLKPDDPMIPTEIGHLLALDERYSDAAAFFERAIQLNPKDETIYISRHNALRKAGNALNLLEMARDWSTVFPKSDGALEQLALAETMQGNIDSTATICRRLTSTWAVSRVAINANARGFPEQANKILREQLSRKHNDERAQLANTRSCVASLVKILITNGDVQGAINTMDSLGPWSDGNWSLSCDQITKVLVANRLPIGAIQFWEEVERRHPNHIGVKRQLARLFTTVNQLERAIDYWKKVAQSRPDKSYNVYGHMAEAYASLGEYDKATEQIQRTFQLKRVRGSGNIDNLMAWILVTLPDEFRDDDALEQSVTLARATYYTAPNRRLYFQDDRGSFAYTLGIAYLRTKQWDKAAKTLEESERRGFDHPFNWIAQAICLSHLGEQQRARRYYEKAVAWRQKTRSPGRMFGKNDWRFVKKLFEQAEESLQASRSRRGG